MPRQDQDNRNDSGFYRPKYDEPLSKAYGVKLFASDEEKIKAIATEYRQTPTETIRAIVRQWLILSETASLKLLRSQNENSDI